MFQVICGDTRCIFYKGIKRNGKYKTVTNKRGEMTGCESNIHYSNYFRKETKFGRRYNKIFVNKTLKRS